MRKRGEHGSRIFKKTSIPVMAPRLAQPQTRALRPLTPPEGLLRTSRMVFRSLCEHEACQRPGTSSLHERPSAGGLGVTSGARRSIGRTRIWGEGTHPPRLNARRYTKRSTVLEGTEPRCSMRFGRELAQAVVPPPSEAPRRGITCPGRDMRGRGTVVDRSPASLKRQVSVSEVGHLGCRQRRRIQMEAQHPWLALARDRWKASIMARAR